MSMGNLNKLALTAQEALQQTITIASENEASQAEPIHMLKALLESKENNLSAIIKRIGAEPFQLMANVDDEILRMPKVSASGPMMMSGVPGPALMGLIDSAVKIAEKLGDSYATSEHLLIALAEEKGAAGKILNAAGITRKTIEAAYEELRGDTRVTDQQNKVQFEALEQYGQNLTQQAREGKLDPVIGRAAPSRCCPAARRTTPCSSASPAPARRPSWRAWPSASSTATCPRRSRTETSSPSICRRCWPALNTAASSRTA